MVETSKINEIVEKIATKFKPQKIFLFGSYASGNPGENSDVDILIVKESRLPRYKRGFDIRKSLIGSMVPMDIIVYTPNEFENEKNLKYSFINNALKSSKLLYERS